MKEINIETAHGYADCILKRKNKNEWVFDGNTKKTVPDFSNEPTEEHKRLAQMKFFSAYRSMNLNVACPTLDLAGLRSFIRTFELIRKEKIDTRGKDDKSIGEYTKYIKWKSNEAGIRIMSHYNPRKESYSIWIRVKNKFRVNYEGDEYHKEYALRDTGVYDTSYYPHHDNYGGTGIGVSEEGMTNFIEDMIKEYEEVSGKKYERLES